MIEIDVYLGAISRFWIQYTSLIEKGESKEGRKEKFLNKLKDKIPVDQLIYTDYPLDFKLDGYTSSLIAVTHISDIEDLYFPSQVGQYHLLTFEYVQGAYTGLYSK